MNIHNPTESQVLDYPIEDKVTKEVKLWSIKPGETLKFPDNVGTYLLEVYGFLQRVMTQEEKEKEDAMKVALRTNTQFNQEKIIDAPTRDISRPQAGQGYTTQTVQGINLNTVRPTATPLPTDTPDVDLGGFVNKEQVTPDGNNNS